MAQPSSRAAGDIVTASLARYAERGVFRGFRADVGRAGRRQYEFVWLTGRPMRVVFDPARRALRFPDLFPAVPPRSPIGSALAALVAGRADRGQPAHKRLDQRRARVSVRRRAGGLTLAFAIRGPRYDYVVRYALNLVNELFLVLHATYPDYLVEQFGVPAE